MPEEREFSDTQTVIQFIRHFRSLEKSGYPEANALIKQIVPLNQYEKLCNQWQDGKKDFGPFYLNLSAKAQVKLLNLWGIEDEKDVYFLQQCEIDPMYGMSRENRPLTLQRLNVFVLFFTKYTISEKPVSSITIAPEKLPKENKRIGNTKNWGDFVLSLKESGQLLNAIFLFYRI